jgi:hypothetical protein
MDFLLDLTALVHHLCVGCTAKTRKLMSKGLMFQTCKIIYMTLPALMHNLGCYTLVGCTTKTHQLTETKTFNELCHGLPLHGPAEVFLVSSFLYLWHSFFSFFGIPFFPSLLNFHHV